MKLTNEKIIADDVRMRGFRRRSSVVDVLGWLDQQSFNRSTERLPIQDAAGRVLTEDVISQINIPNFARSMMDGYAIIASDSQGASPYNQLSLQVIGKSMPGKGTDVSVTSGTAVRIMTGAPIPEGANAILPAENVDLEAPFILIMESVAEKRNIGRVGEDICANSLILERGRRLRPQDIALLASLGEKTVQVKQQLRVRIVVTGTEILPVGTAPKGYQITNSNGPLLEALSTRDGALVTHSSIVNDEPELIESAMQGDYDILLITGGTSVGEEDLVPILLAKLGDLAIHGVAMRPSRSTGMGSIDEKRVFLLPGNPVACLCAYDFFAGRLIRQYSGQKRDWPYLSVRRKLKHKIVSMLGRTDYARVRLSGNEAVESMGISGAAILSSTTQADGFIIVPENSEGYAPETDVEVFLYD